MFPDLFDGFIGTKGTAGVEVCIKCKVEGKTMQEWSKFYAQRWYAEGDLEAALQDPFDKDEATTKYYATIDPPVCRSKDEMQKYENHVTHCTPCNLDPSRNYVSGEFSLFDTFFWSDLIHL